MIKDNLRRIKETLPSGVTLVAVSKFRPVSQLMEVYETGHRDFGENRVQEMTAKYGELPKDIRWHLIGHLQSNKVKYIAPFVHLIHSVDSTELAAEIQKQAIKNQRVISVLLQVHIAREETKSGILPTELLSVLTKIQALDHLRICGLMGMATLTNEEDQVRSEFHLLQSLFNEVKAAGILPPDQFSILSMGMSGDYRIAVEEGSTMIRIGSSIFEG